jgi:hypothetical protein
MTCILFPHYAFTCQCRVEVEQIEYYQEQDTVMLSPVEHACRKPKTYRQQIWICLWLMKICSTHAVRLFEVLILKSKRVRLFIVLVLIKFQGLKYEYQAPAIRERQLSSSQHCSQKGQS